ncbi:MAG: RNA 2',3'-cyclic phosphodiesterase [Nitrospirota bacterium]|nr:RNA 2',3'-cyclic phosphodiesterase [Nitrospirota bacterium]MDE3225457.1 RNA 2',3'-cyclic phosphodiesterase [Nitrospirota bacterium]MDE3242333.1 RNA 2',3'-cyclic phosphodiesterase [Nitrospirota bacterium]
MIRAFLAVELPVEIRQALALVQTDVKNRISRELSPRMRLQWVRPESVHLTVKFLGDIQETQVHDLQSVVGEALRSVAPFSIEVAGLGVFPDMHAPRVLWVGLVGRAGIGGPPTALLQLVNMVETSVEPLGYPPETRPFNPHLTLARIKEGSKEVGRAIARIGLLEREVPLGQLEVSRVALMRSELKPSGSVYTTLWEIPLGAA